MKIEKQILSSGVFRVELKGVIDERASFKSEIGPISGTLEIHSKFVDRINSAGIQIWRKYFKDLRESGVQLRFHELSTPLVTQANSIKDMVSFGEVISACVPYLCVNCQETWPIVMSHAELIQAYKGTIPASACQKCGCNGAFDDFPDYFSFARGEDISK
jgi:anti-anti-sigma regulatory factor